MRVLFNRTFDTRADGAAGFVAGEVYDLDPSAAAYWKNLGVAVDAPPLPEPKPEPQPAPAAPQPTQYARGPLRAPVSQPAAPPITRPPEGA